MIHATTARVLRNLRLFFSFCSILDSCSFVFFPGSFEYWPCATPWWWCITIFPYYRVSRGYLLVFTTHWHWHWQKPKWPPAHYTHLYFLTVTGLFLNRYLSTTYTISLHWRFGGRIVLRITNSRKMKKNSESKDLTLLNHRV